MLSPALPWNLSFHPSKKISQFLLKFFFSVIMVMEPMHGCFYYFLCMIIEIITHILCFRVSLFDGFPASVWTSKSDGYPLIQILMQMGDDLPPNVWQSYSVSRSLRLFSQDRKPINRLSDRSAATPLPPFITVSSIIFVIAYLNMFWSDAE